jgi:hypothetical protein
MGTYPVAVSGHEPSIILGYEQLRSLGAPECTEPDTTALADSTVSAFHVLKDLQGDTVA